MHWQRDACAARQVTLPDPGDRCVDGGSVAQSASTRADTSRDLRAVRSCDFKPEVELPTWTRVSAAKRVAGTSPDLALEIRLQARENVRGTRLTGVDRCVA